MTCPKTMWPLAVRRLERALAAPQAGRERQWATRLATAVAEVARALDMPAGDADPLDGLCDEPELMRPSLVRQVGQLRQEHADLLAVASRLHSEACSAAEAFTFPASSGSGGPVPPGTGRTVIPDFGRLRQQAQELLDAVRRHEHRETALVLESVTTDIGVGD
jgi:hypothetical protein